MRKGIVDEGFERIAVGVLEQQDLSGGVDLSKQVKELRHAVGDAGLYYDESVVNSALSYLELPEGDSEDQYVMLEGTEKWGTNHLDMSNMEAVLKELREKAYNDLVSARGGEYAVRVFNPDGSMTAGGQVIEGVLQALANYPVLDDEDLSRREYKDAVESIFSNGSRYVSDEAPEDWPEQVFTWLWKNDQRALETDTDGSIYVPEKSIEAALEDLGFAYEEEDEDDEDYEEPDPMAEGFATGPVPVDPRQTSLPFKGGRRRAQAAPPVPEEEEGEALTLEELEEVPPDISQKRKPVNWNDLIWGPFRVKSRRRRKGQMSFQDETIIRMVEEEDAQLVNFRGGYALVPLDGRAYPVDEAGADLALAHGAEDRTKTNVKTVSASRRKAQSSGPTGNEIIDSMARTLFVDAWARDWEYLFEDYRWPKFDEHFLERAADSVGVEVPDFRGAELMDISPSTDTEAYVEAQKFYDAIQKANPGVDLETFVPPGEDPDNFDREDFGHYLAMQAMGSGVRWSDSHPDHGLKIPYRENNIFTDEVYRVRSAAEAAAASGGEEGEEDLTMSVKDRENL